VRKKKKKLDTPILAHLENILRKRNICAAAYHGGKLNGVDCRELMTVANEIFDFDIKPYLLSISRENRCPDSKIENACNIHRDICTTLDALTGIIRIKNGIPQHSHFEAAEKHLENLFKLWDEACLSFTPKVHSLLSHALEQMKRLGGIGDTLEDDIEHMHQISARLEARVSRMKNKEQQAFIHSKMESIQSHKEVTKKVEEVKMESKRNFTKRNLEFCAQTRTKKLKEERDERRAQAAIAIEQTSYAKLTTTHEERKSELLQSKQLHDGGGAQSN
jgi:hypothetical protein